jgi:hypothetical protein
VYLYLSFRHGSGRTLEVNIEASCLALRSTVCLWCFYRLRKIRRVCHEAGGYMV